MTKYSIKLFLIYIFDVSVKDYVFIMEFDLVH